MKAIHLRILSSIFFAVAILPAIRTTTCPRTCSCQINRNDQKEIMCDRGGMTRIPTLRMDRDIRVLKINKGRGPQNDLTIGRIFQGFEYLEELVITDSNIPAIGEMTFAGMHYLKILDLSRNEIQLRQKDFLGIDNLERLYLNDNSIRVPPSGAFCNLTRLKTLALARNEIILAPRLFMCLKNLETLDLSGNNISRIDPEVVTDLKPLRHLHLRDCNLKNIHSLVYQMLPNLVELDLRDNLFITFAPHEFKYLRNLRTLRLDNNHISIIQQGTFEGHRLDFLGLANNKLTTIPENAVYNLTITDLDISGNSLTHFHVVMLSNLIQSLRGLSIGNTDMSIEVISSILDVFTNLKRLSLAHSRLNTFPLDMFAEQQKLNVLNISHNKFTRIDPDIFNPLRNLRTLDLSYNMFTGINRELSSKLENMPLLSKVMLRDNRFRCDLCNIPNLLHWMNTSRLFRYQDCQIDPFRCVRCMSPPRLSGRDVKRLSNQELRYCADPDSQASILTMESQIGIFVAVAICILLVGVIMVIMLFYQHHQGAYYTHEEDREGSYINESGTIGQKIREDGPINGKASLKASIKSGINRNEGVIYHPHGNNVRH